MSTKLKIGMMVLVSWSKGRCVGVVKEFRVISGYKWVKVLVKNGNILVLEKQCKEYHEGFRLDELLDL